MKNLNKRNIKKDKKVRNNDKVYKDINNDYLSDNIKIDESKFTDSYNITKDNNLTQSFEKKNIENTKIDKRYSDNKKENLNSYDYRNKHNLNKENYKKVSYGNSYYNTDEYSNDKQNDHLEHNNHKDEKYSYNNYNYDYDEENPKKVNHDNSYEDSIDNDKKITEFSYYENSGYIDDKLLSGSNLKDDKKYNPSEVSTPLNVDQIVNKRYSDNDRIKNSNNKNYYYEDSSDIDKKTFDYGYYENASDTDKKSFSNQETKTTSGKTYDDKISPVFKKDPIKEKLEGYKTLNQIVNKRYSDNDRIKNNNNKNYYYEDSSDIDKKTFDNSYYENASDTDKKSFSNQETKTTSRKTYDDKISPVFKKDPTKEKLEGYKTLNQIVNKRYSDNDRIKNSNNKNYYYEDSSDIDKKTFDYGYYENASDTDKKSFSNQETKTTSGKTYDDKISPVFKKDYINDTLKSYSLVNQIIKKRTLSINNKNKLINSKLFENIEDKSAQKLLIYNKPESEVSKNNKGISTFLAGHKLGKDLRKKSINFTSRKVKGLANATFRSLVLELQSEDTIKRMFNAGYDIKTKGKLTYLLSKELVNTGVAVLALPLLPLKKKISHKETDNFLIRNIKYQILKPRSTRALKKALKNNELGRLYINPNMWKEFISNNDIGLKSINFKKIKAKKLLFNKNNIKKLLENKKGAEFLKKRNARRLYKKHNKALNKKLKKNRQIRNLTKIVVLDGVRKISNNMSVDNGNLALSGFDTGVDIYRNTFKTTKAIGKFGVKTGEKVIKLGKKGTKGAYKQFKITNKAIKGKSFRDKLLFRNVKAYKKIYRDSGFKSAFKTVFKDLMMNLKELFKKLMVTLMEFIKSAVIFMLGFFSSFMIPVFLVVSIIIVSIFGVSRIYPMTRINLYDDVEDVEGEDFKEYFKFLRELNNFGRVNEYDGNPDNSKVLISIAARYFDNDFSDEEKVKKYLTYLHDISHIVKKEEENGMTKIVVKTYEKPEEILKMIKDGTATEEDDDTVPVGSSESSSSEGYNYSSDQVKEAFEKIVQEKNINASQIEQWKYIIDHESGWNPLAKNPSSGAYGLGQAYPASKMASYGSDYLTNPYTQLRWMYDYMNQAYGGITNSYNFWRSHHWY